MESSSTIDLMDQPWRYFCAYFLQHWLGSSRAKGEPGSRQRFLPPLPLISIAFFAIGIESGVTGVAAAGARLIRPVAGAADCLGANPDADAYAPSISYEPSCLCRLPAELSAYPSLVDHAAIRLRVTFC